MSKKSEGTVTCDVCASLDCRSRYPKGVPAYCLATRERQVLEETKLEYSKPENLPIYVAAGRMISRGYATYPRVQEAIEFSRELKIKKVGFASCIGLIRELALLSELFRGAGFEVVGANCQVGRVPPSERFPDVKEGDITHMWCNPIAQAEILNKEGSELNFIVGLCLGHDMLFTRYSKAPVSTLIVKDRVLGHNPAAALYASPVRNNLAKAYCGRDNL